MYSMRRNNPTGNGASVTPTPGAAAEQLPVEQQPKIQMTFSADAHFATVELSNLHAAKMEYNLIYDAKVKTSRLQTGVNDSQDITGKTSYTKKQLLGSESSGKFTYHEDIKDAVLELTLRDSANRSVFTATYPFTVTAGKTVSLTPTSE